MDILELFARFDIISRIEGWVSTFRRADWQAAGRRGAAGIADEFGRCLTRSNAPLIHFQRNAGWTGIQVERLLRGYGVRIFDRGFTRDTLCFRVAQRQHDWADYLMRRAGVPVVSAPTSATNAQAWQRHRGTMPTPWEGERRGEGPAPADADDFIGRVLATFDELF